MTELSNFAPVLVHTGQHYDAAMSDIFFEQLGLPEPDHYLGVGSGTHAEQTARIMIAFEQVCREQSPDLVLLVGDVNSTLACSLVASKLLIPVAHVEAGLRSGDRTMPEEINRILTDAVSDYLFVHSVEAIDNLLSEGVTSEKIYNVGNVMIDSLVIHLDRAEQAYERRYAADYARGKYGIITLHRPSNVDDPVRIAAFMKVFSQLSERLPLVFPIHPRLRKMITNQSSKPTPRLHFMNPLGYLDFVGLLKNARLVITDSGGLQEETTYLNIPCVTARDNTERPITVEMGSNLLAGSDPEKVLSASLQQLHSPKTAQQVPLWDGKASDRIAAVLSKRN
jgi:UDP-N-acetylglucosamine 2-epimerase (non-hydrolysing)